MKRLSVSTQYLAGGNNVMLNQFMCVHFDETTPSLHSSSDLTAAACVDQGAGTTESQECSFSPQVFSSSAFCVLYLFKNMLEHQISLCTEPSLFVYLGTRKVRRKKGEFKCDKANILPSFTLSTQSLPNIIVCIVYIDAFTDTQSCGVKATPKIFIL